MNKPHISFPSAPPPLKLAREAALATASAATPARPKRKTSGLFGLTRTPFGIGRPLDE